MKKLRALGALTLCALVMTSMAASGQRNPPPPPPEEKLLEVLRSDAPLQQKTEACRQLGQVGTRNAVPALAGLLGDAALADRARYALEQIPDPAVTAALRNSAPKLQGRYLAGVLNSLGVRLDTEKATKADTDMLGRHLKSSDAEVATAAAYALARIGTPVSTKIIEQAMPSASVTMKPVLWDAALRGSAKMLATGQSAAAAGVYGRLLASSAPTHIKVGAARGSVLANKKDSLQRLVRLLENSDPAMFNVGLELAQGIPGPAATKAVAAAIPRLPADRQPLLMEALAGRGDKSALPVISAAARQGATPLRVAAINGLGAMGDAASLSILVDAAAQKDTAVAGAASAAIVRLRGSGVDEALTNLASGQDAARSLVAMDALTRRVVTSSVPALFRAARSGSSEVRLAAINALGRLASTSDVSSLLDVMQEVKEDTEVEAAEQSVADVCARSGDPQGCVDKAVSRLGSARPPVKRALVRVLAGLGGARALDAVRGAAKDGDTDVRDTSVRSLSNWATPDAAPDLIVLAKEGQSPTHKLLALRGYIRLAGHDSLPADRRLAMCAEAKPLITRDDEKRLLLGSASTVTSVEALTTIAPFIEDEGVSDEASAAAVAVAGKLLRGPDAAKAEFKPRLPQIAAVLEKARQASKDNKLQTEIQALQARVTQLQG